jgi:hypothetical protein
VGQRPAGRELASIDGTADGVEVGIGTAAAPGAPTRAASQGSALSNAFPANGQLCLPG